MLCHWFMILSIILIKVQAHGNIVRPAPRAPGPQMLRNCGQQVYNKDRTGNVEDYRKTGQQQKDYNEQSCNLMLCRGTTYEDNKDKVQQLKLGQKLDINYKIVAPHTGSADFKVLEIGSGSAAPIATLKHFEIFASNSRDPQKEESAFSVAIPPNLGGKCTRPGQCVLQMLWYSSIAKQTYPSCIDFVIKN